MASRHKSRSISDGMCQASRLLAASLDRPLWTRRCGGGDAEVIHRGCWGGLRFATLAGVTGEAGTMPIRDLIDDAGGPADRTVLTIHLEGLSDVATALRQEV